MADASKTDQQPLTQQQLAQLPWTDVIKYVYGSIRGLSVNDEFRKRIENNLERLEKVTSYLNELQEDDIPEPITSSFNDSLGICKSICTSLGNRGKAAKFFNVQGHRRELETLELELREACNNLQLMLIEVLFIKNKRLEGELQRCYREIGRDVIHPGHGVFLPNGKAIGSCPLEIEQPEVNLDESGDCIVVKWRDDKNTKDTIDRYEVRYDDESNMVVSATVEECMLLESPDSFSIRLGSPRIRVGGLYTVQVRGTNGTGPGKWSEPTIFRFKVGPPNKPKKPTATALSPTEIEITASRLSQKDENGSSVTYCMVEYTQKIDSDNPKWGTLQCPMPNDESVKFKVRSLKLDTTYCFRIKMTNGAGESPPSDSLEAMTSQFRPDPPQNLCVSVRQTATTIDWKEPALNPQAAYMYNVQMRPAEKAQKWEDYDPVKEKSMEFTRLKTNTRYLFRVRSINKEGKAGRWSSEIGAKTQVGKLRCALTVIGAAIGGAFGGLVLLGIVLMGFIGDVCGGDYEEGLCFVWATGNRVISPLVIGLISAIWIYKKLRREIVFESP